MRKGKNSSFQTTASYILCTVSSLPPNPTLAAASRNVCEFFTCCGSSPISQFLKWQIVCRLSLWMADPRAGGSAASIIQRGIAESNFFEIPGRHGWLCLLPAVWPWATHVTFLHLYFLIYKIGILVWTSQSCLQELYESTYIGLTEINTIVPSGGAGVGIW